MLSKSEIFFFKGRTSKGSTGRSRQDAGQEGRAGPGHMCLLGSMGGKLWGSQAEARLVNSNTDEQGFGKLHNDLM